jgi:hypothetical protein
MASEHPGSDRRCGAAGRGPEDGDDPRGPAEVAPPFDLPHGPMGDNRLSFFAGPEPELWRLPGTLATS